MRGTPRWRGWLLAAAAGLALLPFPVLATLGAGVGASPITLSQPVQSGHTYQLPSLYVINTGTEAAYYQVRGAGDRPEPGPSNPGVLGSAASKLLGCPIWG